MQNDIGEVTGVTPRRPIYQYPRRIPAIAMAAPHDVALVVAGRARVTCVRVCVHVCVCACVRARNALGQPVVGGDNRWPPLKSRFKA